MQRALRSQADDLGNYYSEKGGLSFNDSPSVTRQEFKDETDINNILRNFGVDNQQRTMTQFGEADYTIDLQQALHSIHDTQRAYERMGKEIHDIYPTYSQFVRGVQSGQVEKDLKRLADEKIPATRKAEIRAQLEREKEREQLLRDDEADRIARDFKEGRPSPKEDSKPK